MEKIEKLKLALLDYDITAHSYIQRSGQGDLRRNQSPCKLCTVPFPRGPVCLADIDYSTYGLLPNLGLVSSTT